MISSIALTWWLKQDEHDGRKFSAYKPYQNISRPNQNFIKISPKWGEYSNLPPKQNEYMNLKKQ